MLPTQRDSIILDLLHKHGLITVAEVVALCHCSPITARRDLHRLEEQGHLQRTHGGAVSVAADTSGPAGAHPPVGPASRLRLTDRSDVLIVTPEETTTTRLLLDRARRAGVPIIAESIDVPGSTTLIAIDDYRAGLELGRWAAGYARDHLGGVVKALDVTCSLPNTTARSRGFADGLSEVLPDGKIVLRIDGQGLRHVVQQVVADALAVHPDINVIFGINDDSALGALDAYRGARLDESSLLLLSVGFEGQASRDLLASQGPYRAAAAMFPELVGRTCVEAAVSAYNRCPVPAWIETPFAIVTADTLHDYYQKDAVSEGWSINWSRVKALPSVARLKELADAWPARSVPARIGFLQVFSSHDWYRNVSRAMEQRSQTLGITLDVVDASQDLAIELAALKQAIGRTAARFVRPGDTIIVDTGSTTAYLAQALRGHQDITVITNSVTVLDELADEPGITLISTGGVLRSGTRALTGPGAEASLQDLRADRVFISGTGLSLTFGLSNTNIPETAVKQAMIRAAREVILLTDHSKIGTESLVKVAPLGAIHRLITDAGLSPQNRLALVQRGIDVVIADESGTSDAGVF